MAVKLMIRDLDDPDRCRIEGVGFDLKTPSEKDVRAFGLLRETGYHPGAWEACRYILGRVPNDMWLGDPTGNQFGSKGYELNEHWKHCQVRRTFKSGRIVSLDTEPEILSAVRHDNSHNSDPGTFQAGLSRDVADTIERSHESSMTHGFALTLGVELGSEASGVKAKVETTYSMEASESDAVTKGKTKTLSANLGTEVEVPAGKVKRSVLYAAFGRAVFDVTYDLELIGDAYFYFKKAVPNIGHHANVDVVELRRIMREVYDKNAPATVQANERLEIGVFGDSYASLEDLPVEHVQ